MILASASPRRRQLLDDAGIRYTSEAPSIVELAPRTGDPHAVAALNAARKAEAVEGELVLGADTVVALGDELLGKPRDRDDARSMLARLSGTTHRVVTGVALKRQEQVDVRTEETRVTMRTLTDAELDAYADSGEGQGKAGGYAIQETADRFVINVEGSFSNVVGLPVELAGAMIDRACGGAGSGAA